MKQTFTFQPYQEEDLETIFSIIHARPAERGCDSYAALICETPLDDAGLLEQVRLSTASDNIAMQAAAHSAGYRAVSRGLRFARSMTEIRTV